MRSCDRWRSGPAELLLDCSTQVSDLGPLAGLSALQSLYCSDTQVSDLPEPLVWLESLKKLVLFNTHITDIPAEVLSPTTPRTAWKASGHTCVIWRSERNVCRT